MSECSPRRAHARGSSCNCAPCVEDVALDFPFSVEPNVRAETRRARRRTPTSPSRDRRDLAPRDTVEACAIELDALAVAERHGRIREVSIREDAVRVGGRARDDRGTRQYLLLGVAQRVRAAAEDVVEVEVVDLQPRFPAMNESTLAGRSSESPVRRTRFPRRMSRRSAPSPAACPGIC